MDTKAKWKYVLLGVAAFVVVLVIVYLRVSAYFNVPLISLLPGLPFTKSVISPTPATKPSSVKRFDLEGGNVMYTVKGRFVSAASYHTSGLLRSEFVIDEDPYKSRIPVYMTKQDGKINVGKSPDASFGKITWMLTLTEDLRKAIKPDSPVILQIVYFENHNSSARAVFQPALNRIIRGEWDLPQNFTFVPTGVAVVQ